MEAGLNGIIMWMGFYLVNFFLFFFCFSYFLGVGPALGGFARGFFTGGGAHCADGAGRAAKFAVFFVFFGLKLGSARGRGSRGPTASQFLGQWIPAGPLPARRMARAAFFSTFFFSNSFFFSQAPFACCLAAAWATSDFLFSLFLFFVGCLRALKPPTKDPIFFSNSLAIF